MNVVPLDIAQFAGHLIAQSREPSFVEALNSELKKVADFDLSAVFAFPLGTRPTLLHDGFSKFSEKGALATYISGAYLLDACYVACHEGRAPGIYRLSEVAPDSFFEAEYYNSPAVHPCISLESGTLAEEIFFLSQPKPGLFFVYSLMRSSAMGGFTNEELNSLRSLVPIVNALLGQHFRSELILPGLRPNNKFEAAEGTFATFQSEVLSKREQDIVRLILRGHSSASVAQILNIAEGTVKNHRKHIYAKLSISSQGELFTMFLAHALNSSLRQRIAIEE